MNEVSLAPPQSPAHCREREAEIIAFAAALAVVSVVFSLWPSLDLMFSRAFHEPGVGFWIAGEPWVLAVHHTVPWVGRTAFLVAVVVTLTPWVKGPWRRRLQLVGLSLLLGVSALVNGALKENWGRARPVAVEPFGGAAQFVPALRPGEQCRTNCSFTSGHAATGFVLGAVGLLSAPARRRRWLLAGIACGCALGLLRVAQGGHFASDVLFSGLAMWFCHLVLRGGWLRWRLRRLRRFQQRTLSGSRPAPLGSAGQDP